MVVPIACFKVRLSSVGEPNNGPRWTTPTDINVSKSKACWSLGTCPSDQFTLTRLEVEIISHTINHVHASLERIGSGKRCQLRPSLYQGSQQRGMESRNVPFMGHERSRSKVSNSIERDIDRRWEEDVACRGTTNTTRRWTHGSAPLRRVAFGKRAMDSPAGSLG